MSGGKMSFPKEEYQIMAEDGQSGSESLKQINGGRGFKIQLKGINAHNQTVTDVLKQNENTAPKFL